MFFVNNTLCEYFSQKTLHIHIIYIITYIDIYIHYIHILILFIHCISHKTEWIDESSVKVHYFPSSFQDIIC